MGPALAWYLGQQQDINEVHGLALFGLEPGLSAHMAQSQAALLHHISSEAVHNAAHLLEALPISHEIIDAVKVVQQLLVAPHYQVEELQDVVARLSGRQHGSI